MPTFALTIGTRTQILLLTLITTALATPSIRNASPNRFTNKKFATVRGKRMAYVEVGTGDPIVFLHGNPTSSFLWRNVMPHVEGRGRLIAPDLIGMGDSDKLDNSGPDRYTFVEHSNYLFQLLERLSVKENVTLVMHDWGAVGFLWAYYNRGNPNAVKGIVFLEAHIAPLPSYEVLPEAGREIIEMLRGPEGERLVLEEDFFVDSVFLGNFGNLTEEEQAEYRRPFLNHGEDRRPLLTWLREIPIAGEPANVAKLIGAYSKWLSNSKVRKLFINVEPGSLSSFMRPIVRKWLQVTEVTVPGIHFAQEDSPNEIGNAINDWL